MAKSPGYLPAVAAALPAAGLRGGRQADRGARSRTTAAERVTPDARVVQFPPSVPVRPQDYGQFSCELSADELAGCFCFSDDDRRKIARRRGDVNRLGFAVQLGRCAISAGSSRTRLAPPSRLSRGRRGRLVSRRAPTWPATARVSGAERTRLRSVGPTAIGRSAPPESSLSSWRGCGHALWVTAESSRALFARAGEFLIGRRILLPGWSTLWRLIGSARERADERRWRMLAATLNGEQHGRLERLLRVTAARRVTDLDRLRTAPVEPPIKGADRFA